MNKDEKTKVLNAKTIATNISFGGIEIKAIEYGINDYVVFVAGSFYGKKSVHKARIRYFNRGYFMYNGYRIYFDECIRCD